jgi:hypothetical protein
MGGRHFLVAGFGFGVFTMPQEMAACSIILCTYLGAPALRGYGLLHLFITLR